MPRVVKVRSVLKVVKVLKVPMVAKVYKVRKVLNRFWGRKRWCRTFLRETVLKNHNKKLGLYRAAPTRFAGHVKEMGRMLRLKADLKYIKCGVCRKMVDIAYEKSSEVLEKRFKFQKKWMKWTDSTPGWDFLLL